MRIPLIIDIDKDNIICDEKCMFREVDFLDNFGKCLLFNEPLRYKIEKRGGDIIWHNCEQCRNLVRKTVENDE